MFGLEELAN